jgi:cytochrome b561
MMRKSQTLKLVNPILFLVILAQFAVALGMKFFAQGWMYPVHEYLGYSIGLLALLHLGLNWAWVKSTYLAKSKAPKLKVGANSEA